MKIPALPCLVLALAGCTPLLPPFSECEVDEDCPRAAGADHRVLCADGRCGFAPPTPADGETTPRDAPPPADEERSSEAAPETMLRPVDPSEASLVEGPCWYVHDGLVARDAPTDRMRLIGLLLPLTGPLAEPGQDMERAALLALEEINQAGGLQGRPLGALVCDTGTDAEQGIAALEHLVHEAGVQVVVGAAASGVTVDAFHAVARDAGVLMMSPSATSPVLSFQDDDGLLWRVAPSDALQGRALGAFLRARGTADVAIINRADRYGDPFVDQLLGELCELDCAGVRLWSYAESTFLDDVSAAVHALSAAPPRMLGLVSYADDGLEILRLLDAAGVLDQVDLLLFSDGLHQQAVLDDAPPAALPKILGTLPAGPENALAARWRLRFESKWRRSPGAYTEHTYDAVMVLALALGATGNPRASGGEVAAQIPRLTEGRLTPVGAEHFAQTLLRLSADPEARIDLDGVSGNLDFDLETGEPPGNVAAWVVDIEPTPTFRTLGVMYTEDGRFFDPFTGVGE